MNFEINEKDINEYAAQRLKQGVDRLVKQRLVEMNQGYQNIDRIVYECVAERITNEMVKVALANIDRAALIQTIAKDMAELLVDKLIIEID